MSAPWLTLLWAVPAVGAVAAAAAAPRAARWIGLLASAVALAIGIGLAWAFDTAGDSSSPRTPSGYRRSAPGTGSRSTAPAWCWCC
ncbi:hypothetical protein MTP03_10210 [Tsukamurella sp. PLM1]|nr:hypothetical protein MTP03_10210 [Tsukamurella sp. PLM1]